MTEREDAHWSPAACAREILRGSVEGEPWPRDAVSRLAASGDGALFSILAEGLSDRFEKRLADVYADIFAGVIAPHLPGWTAETLRGRYERVRRPRPLTDVRVDRVVVLSRVTLGADVAVTSVLLEAARRRFPNAQLVLTGGAKNYELFAADRRIEHLAVAYGRSGSVADRLSVLPVLERACSGAGTIVIDSDSRLTQLGLLPICPEERYFLFESRVYGGDGHEPLPALARRWAAETLGVEGATAYIAPASSPRVPGEPFVTLSLGVGGNPAKRIDDPFERELIRMLCATGLPVVIDAGAGGEEAERVRRATGGLPVRTLDGSFAEFAAAVAKSRLYVGYDSAGQHVAAACGVPLLTVFAGFPSPRMFDRWRPYGPGPREVIRVEDPEPAAVLAEAEPRLKTLLRADPDRESDAT